VGVGEDPPEYKMSSGRTNSSLDGRKRTLAGKEMKTGTMILQRCAHKHDAA